MGVYIRDLLPYFIFRRLWGDRARWGLTPIQSDPNWQEWQDKISTKSYLANQRDGIGLKVCNLGYSVMSKVDVNEKTILEIGPGDIKHIDYWKELKPAKFILADKSASMLDIAEKRLSDTNINYERILIPENGKLSIKDESLDIVISFNSLEHIFPLKDYVRDISRFLKPGGILIGAIPSEGGFAWGAGRYLTTRRWMKKNSNIDLDKIICWEHCNFADHIIEELDNNFNREFLEFSPFKIPSIDLNLVIRYCYSKR